MKARFRDASPELVAVIVGCAFEGNDKIERSTGDFAVAAGNYARFALTLRHPDRSLVRMRRKKLKHAS